MVSLSRLVQCDSHRVCYFSHSPLSSQSLVTNTPIEMDYMDGMRVFDIDLSTKSVTAYSLAREPRRRVMCVASPYHVCSRPFCFSFIMVGCSCCSRWCRSAFVAYNATVGLLMGGGDHKRNRSFNDLWRWDMLARNWTLLSSLSCDGGQSTSPVRDSLVVGVNASPCS